MAFYECTLITRPDLSKGDVQKLVDGFAKIITDHKGKILKNEYWGLRQLAYLINKASKGHYAMLGIEASPEALKELERNLGIHEDIVRSLTVRFETMDASPSVMMQQKSGESSDAA
ncbi:MAG: 30S ribosomal protein S6 [Alphaproteobacteria bacterium]